MSQTNTSHARLVSGRDMTIGWYAESSDGNGLDKVATMPDLLNAGHARRQGERRRARITSPKMTNGHQPAIIHL